MSRKTFTAKDKAKAVQLMLEKKLTMKQIAKKFGCSLSALGNWKIDAKRKQQTAVHNEWEEDEWEEDEEVVSCNCGGVSEHPLKKKDAEVAHDFVRQFWNKNFRAVDMLLTAKDTSPDEVVKLVNEALQYAYDHFQK